MAAQIHLLYGALEGFAEPGGVEAAGFEGVAGNVGFFFGIEEQGFEGGADFKGVSGESEEFAGGEGEAFDELRPGEFAGDDEGVVEGAEGGFEADDAEGGVIEVEVFGKIGVGGVTGGDHVQGAVAQTFEQGFLIFAGA